MTAPIGINLIGYLSANIGLGVVARELARALIENGHQIAVLDLDAGTGRSGLDTSLQNYFVPKLEDLPHSINIWVTGADIMPQCAIQVCESAFTHTKFNVAFVWWELPNVPLAWSIAAQAFDVIVTGSEFVREAWANHVPATPVLMAQCPLQLPLDVVPDRHRFALPKDAVLFYTGFEPGSDPARKNPFAVVTAFQHAFRDEADVALVVKINNPGSEGRAKSQLKRLIELVGDDRRVYFLRERLSYADLLSLYASCDVIVSLHRAEGLALVPLEAMRLGKPVVATGWSGNMTYMNQANACLVGYDLVPTDNSSFLYSPKKTGMKSFWADPSIEHAAAWFKALHADEGLRRSKGEKALEGSLRYNELALQVGFVSELQALQDQRALRPPKDYSRLPDRIRLALKRQPYLYLSWPRRLIGPALSAFDYQMRRYVYWRFQRPDSN